MRESKCYKLRSHCAGKQLQNSPQKQLRAYEEKAGLGRLEAKTVLKCEDLGPAR